MATVKRLGDVLLDKRLITGAQLTELLAEQRISGQRLGKMACDRKWIADGDLLNVLSDHLDLPAIDLSTFDTDTTLLGLLPERFLMKFRVLPLFLVGNELSVAMVNPKDVEALDEMKRLTGREIAPFLCSEDEIQRAFSRLFKGHDVNIHSEIADALQECEVNVEEVRNTAEDISDEELAEAARETPIVRLSNLIVSAAIHESASDIHIEPEQSRLLVRFRVDGLMKESFVLEKKLQSALISRFKIMSGLDIAEKRLPQDGRFQTRVGHRSIDFRISSFPTIHGENLVLRILDKSNVTLNLEQLGFDKNTLSFFNDLIRRPHGIILVTGPTGSGKTTTLYSALHSINSPDKNIITIEDPIEYRLELVRQCQVHSKIGLTFASGLRSILRQDPDVIMVGEIRDRETAHIAVESALTGHLVFSTLHTNDAPGSINRLIDMGIEPFLVASSTIGVLAQRLVRRLCVQCRETFVPDDNECTSLGLKKGQLFYRPKGCTACNHRGYKGRLAVYELMIINDEIRSLTIERAPASRIRGAALENGMRTLRADGIQKARLGSTSLEEVWRVTAED